MLAAPPARDQQRRLSTSFPCSRCSLAHAANPTGGERGRKKREGKASDPRESPGVSPARSPRPHSTTADTHSKADTAAADVNVNVKANVNRLRGRRRTGTW